MARVSSILARMADDLEQYLPEQSVLQAFVAAGHVWRERQLGPVRTLHLFILQVLACNAAMAHLRQMAGEVFSLGQIKRDGSEFTHRSLPAFSAAFRDEAVPASLRSASSSPVIFRSPTVDSF